MESRSNQQIAETRAHIKALTTEGESEVTAVRIARDQQENERRISQEVSRQARRAMGACRRTTAPRTRRPKVRMMQATIMQAISELNMKSHTPSLYCQTV